VKKLLLILTLAGLAGCSRQVPAYTSSGEAVLMAQHNVSLYRKAPKVWPAKGKVIATADELIFIPTPHYGVLHVSGRDSTYINSGAVVGLREKRWMLVFPFGLEVVTADSTTYSFVTVRRSELVRKIKGLGQGE
jgi:hypothetical protein